MWFISILLFPIRLAYKLLKLMFVILSVFLLFIYGMLAIED